MTCGATIAPDLVEWVSTQSRFKRVAARLLRLFVKRLAEIPTKLGFLDMVRSRTLSIDPRVGKSQVMYLGEKWTIWFVRIDSDGETTNTFYQLMNDNDQGRPMVTVRSDTVEILPEKYGEESNVIY
jgi:hypothetical protein